MDYHIHMYTKNMLTANIITFMQKKEYESVNKYFIYFTFASFILIFIFYIYKIVIMTCVKSDGSGNFLPCVFMDLSCNMIHSTLPYDNNNATANSKRESRKNYEFDYTIITDGYATSLRFLHKDSGTTLRKSISVQLRELYNQKSHGFMRTIPIFLRKMRICIE